MGEENNIGEKEENRAFSSILLLELQHHKNDVLDLEEAALERSRKRKEQLHIYNPSLGPATPNKDIRMDEYMY